jgi:hypothetical protein
MIAVVSHFVVKSEIPIDNITSNVIIYSINVSIASRPALIEKDLNAPHE